MDHDFYEPVDHILVRAGFCSDRSFKTFIKTHKVQIKRNGASFKAEVLVAVEDRNLCADSDLDTILVDGKEIQIPEHLYILLNKPEKVVCSRVSDSHKTVFDFLSEEIRNHAFYEKLHVAGRLDSDSRGLVLLTTNGKFSSSLSKPETHVDKTYSVKLRDSVSRKLQKEYKDAFKKGMDLPPEKKGKAFRTKPATVIFPEGDFSDSAKVTVSEGKFHQVRRMFAALGNEVVDLKRMAIGEIELPENLGEGEFCLWNRT